jgi:hypothetical protein
METLNIEQIFNLPVKKISIKEILPGFEALPYTSYAICIERGEEKIIVGLCSKKFGIIPCSDLFPVLEKEIIKNEYKFTKHYIHQDYCKFYVEYIFENPLEFGLNKEIIKPSIKIVHSYNGSLKYTINFGFWRKICNNGLYGFSSTFSINYKHTMDNVEKIINESLEKLNKFFDKIEEIKIEYLKLEQKQIIGSFEDRVRLIADKTGFPKKSILPVIERIKVESIGGQVNDWIIYSAFNYILNNADFKIYEENKIKLDIKIYNQIVKV